MITVMKKAFVPNDYIEDIELNGLKGRMLNAPSTDLKAKNIDILYVYGSHSSIERWLGVVEVARRYGNVCMPDLPGFGGMTSLYDIGLRPDLDSMADYLAAFVMLRYGKTKKFAITGFSYGFLVVTRMLQKYPELLSRVTMVISLAGFVHYEDFLFTKRRRRLYLIGAYLLRSRLLSWIVREVFFRKWFMLPIHSKTRNAKAKFVGMDKDELKKMMDFEIKLWRINDSRTRYQTYIDLLTINLLQYDTQLSCRLAHVALSADQYFNNNFVEQHMRIAYQPVRIIHAEVTAHAPSVIANAKDVGNFFPPELRKLLKELR